MRKIKQINFDMDGTIADFYGVEGWLSYLEHEDTTPYEVARPLINLSVLAKSIHRVQKLGYEVNIISWLSKSGSDEFQQRITKAKLEWLKQHLPSVTFDKITIVAYGTPKHLYGHGILFDDECGNRNAWKNGIAFDESNILQVLKNLE